MRGNAIAMLILILATGACRSGPRPAPQAGGLKAPPRPSHQLPEGVEDPSVNGLLQDIHFDFDRAEIRIVDHPLLEENAAIIRAHGATKVIIQGHCDERGSVEYNLALGERRAKAARDYLVALGVDASQLSLVSYGKELPLDPGHNEEAWAQNRRSHFLAVR